MITRLHLRTIEPLAGGMSFGAAGAYERVIGTAVGAVDPAVAGNRGIVNLDRAARNAEGRVAYATEFFLLRPADPARGSGTLLYEVVNRGMKLLMTGVMGAKGHGALPVVNDPKTAADLGDALLLKRGMTLLWSGWDPDAVRLAQGLAIEVPSAEGVEGMVRDEFVGGPQFLPGGGLRLSRVPLDPAAVRLTKRRRAEDAEVEVPAAAWRLEGGRQIVLLPDGAASEPGTLYEAYYRSAAPPVAGLGFAATRDLVAHLRYGKGADHPAPGIARGLAVGFSQSGRFLRGFIAQGFNRDEEGRRVFDGVMTALAGAGSVFLNAPFSQPGRTNLQHSDHHYPDFAFPFSTAAVADPISGRGVASLLRGDDSDPVLIEANTATEYWQKGASLLTTDPEGHYDLALPETTRVYFLRGLAHAPFAFGAGFANPVNLAPQQAAMRAMIALLEAWVAKGTAPPPSVVPRLDDGTLVPMAAWRFPGVPGVARPVAPNPVPERADWIDLRARPAALYEALVPAVDGDGNERAGIAMPEVAVPLGTFAGWNLHAAPYPEGELAGLFGSFIPFARTRAERLQAGDPRASLDERYGEHADYAARLAAAAAALARQRFLLEEDAAVYRETAGAGS